MAQDSEGFELTEEVFDLVGAPLIAAFGLTSLESQLEALSDINGQLSEAFAQWEPVMRERATADLRYSIAKIRGFLHDLEQEL